ncbi:CBS domain-containing protein [candidate division GN15 bacterium]|jgi:CBS domain-containing protein|nr:CBS domain-containing protein [candidate division GN15 bacterium]
MLVRNLLEQKAREVITTTPTQTIDAAMDLLIKNNIGCLPVLDDAGKLIGIISDKDVFHKIHETNGKYHDLTVAEVMSTELLIGLPSDELEYIAGIMDKNWIRHIPIVEEERIIGLVSQRDIIKMTARHAELENRYLNLYLEGLHHRDKSADY